jgi:hypothetical protein
MRRWTGTVANGDGNNVLYECNLLAKEIYYSPFLNTLYLYFFIAEENFDDL